MSGSRDKNYKTQITVAIIGGVFVLLAAIWTPIMQWLVRENTSQDSQQPNLATSLEPSMPIIGSDATLDMQLNFVYREQGTGPLKNIVENSVLHSGDHYKIIVTPEQFTYIYIFQSDSNGNIYQLFPMREYKGVVLNNMNPIPKDKRTVLPNINRSFVLDSEVGTERFYVLAFKQQIPDLEYLVATLKGATKQKNAIEKRTEDLELRKYFKKRGLESIVADIETNREIEVAWNESTEIFTILQRRLENICKNCIYIKEFKHQ